MDKKSLQKLIDEKGIQYIDCLLYTSDAADDC